MTAPRTGRLLTLRQSLQLSVLDKQARVELIAAYLQQAVKPGSGNRSSPSTRHRMKRSPSQWYGK